MTTDELVTEVLGLQAGDHLCLIYDSDPAEQMAALLPYVRRGLEEGERCVYVADDHTAGQLSAALTAYGIDVERERERGALLLWTRDEWRQPGELESPRKEQQVRDAIADALAAGYRGVRFAVEMTWTLGPDIAAERLRHWEATINRIFTPEVPARIICQYSRARLAPAIIDAGLRTHPRAIIGSDVCLNLYYDAPLLLEGETADPVFEHADDGVSIPGPSDRRVNWMITQLRWAREIEREREQRARAEAAAQQAERSRAELERLYRREVEQAALMTTINRINEIVSSELDLDRAVQSVTDAATEVTGAEFGAFFYNRLNEDGEYYQLYALSGADRSSFAQFPMPRNTALFGPTFRGEETIRLDDVQQDARYGLSAPYHGLPAGHLPVRSYLAVPVIGRSGEVLGGLFLGHGEPARFSRRHEQIVEGIATQTANVIEHALLYEAAQRAIEIREEFLGIASHELRTPMTVVKGYAMMLARKLNRADLEPNDFRAAVDELVSASDRLEKLVNDLLDTSRIQSGRLELHPEPLDLSEVAGIVVSRFEGDPLLTPRHELVLDAPRPIIGVWDPGRVDQVVTNLVSNALKYSPDGGTVRLTVCGHDGAAELSVTDEGMGISEDARGDLFQAFRRGAANERAIPGSGLGLYISAQIVERHGGTIAVDSEPGKGSTFTVRLPLAPPAHLIEREAEVAEA